MKLSGEYTFTGPRERVWAVLMDRDALKSCLPGCEGFDPIGADQYRVTVKIGVAAVRGTYTGTVVLSDVDEPVRYTLGAQGTGGPGFMKAVTLMELEEQGTATILRWSADAIIGGTVASVGARMLGGVATHIAGQFFKCLESRLVSSVKS